MSLDNWLLQSASAIDPDCRKHSLSLTLMKGLPDLMSSVISVAERDAYDLEVLKARETAPSCGQCFGSRPTGEQNAHLVNI
ncbi:hypothetical protein AVEN_120802-1 [Araneus ventricosus]|uniref:Uncharacterized protein n=1 Tax=Araneus ventricosus TaxID=182803 RepID=A0A4Y2NG08_ARAVE|nr:hypothetical protein AVEN_25437-1 [Araneus ventricosus]GBN39626.1 hypothetical protein AVEN_120802-1 [Araneus ventricosus]